MMEFIVPIVVASAIASAVMIATNFNTRSAPRSNSEKIQQKRKTWNAIDDPEEVLFETEDYIKTEENVNSAKNGNKKCNNSENEKKSNYKRFFDRKERENGAVTVTATAGGNVNTFVNPLDVQIGPTLILGGTNTQQPKPNMSVDPEQHIQKSNFLKLLMAADVKPEQEHIDYVSKNLRENWRNIFMALGFNKRIIERMEMDQENYGEAQARYKLLEQWIAHDERNTLGRLSTILWNEGEREVVKGLALLYNRGR